MKIRALSATALALVAAGAVATPSFARDYGYYATEAACHDKQHDAGTTGAVLGGLAGALLGSSVAGHGSRTGGAVIGGLAGALVGNSIGRSSAKDSHACEARDYGRVDYRARRYYGGDYYRTDYRPYRDNPYGY
jgi:hypothetical protein